MIKFVPLENNLNIISAEKMNCNSFAIVVNTPWNGNIGTLVYKTVSILNEHPYQFITAGEHTTKCGGDTMLVLPIDVEIKQVQNDCA